MKRFTVLMLAVSLFAIAAEELPEIVITAARVEANSGAMAQNVTVITRDELDAMELQTLTDVLAVQSGISLMSSGPRASSASSLSIRGMKGYHTKLLIDNVPFMDVSGTQQASAVGNLPVYDIERIEILKGAVSLQGSSAMGGVINIITRRPEEDGIHARISLEGGSHERFGTNLLLFGKYDFVDFTFGTGYARERGISAVGRDLTGLYDVRDKDSCNDHSYFGRIGLQLQEKVRLDISGMFQDIDEKYDIWGDFDSRSMVWIRRSQWTGRLEGKELLDGIWDTRFIYAYTAMDRKSRQEDYRFIGQTHFLDWMNTFHLHEKIAVTAGVEYEEQLAKDKYGFWDAAHRTRAAYAGIQLEPVENLLLALNGRYTYHNRFGSEWTGDLAASYYVEPSGTTLRASVGKGYRTPSVNELYGLYAWGGFPFFWGNPNLTPEYNTSWEIGVEQEFLDKQAKAGISFFQNNLRNFITTNDTFDSYKQIAGVEINGIETFAEYNLKKTLNLHVGYTWMDARDINATDNKNVPYIPEHKIGADATWYPLEDRRLAWNIGGAWTGKRWNGTAPTSKKLHDFTLIHTAVSYQFTKTVQGYIRIENLLNTNYALNDDGMTRYNTYGRCYYAGLTITL